MSDTATPEVAQVLVHPERVAMGCVCPRMLRNCPIHGWARYHRFHRTADSRGAHCAAWKAWFAAHDIGDVAQIVHDGWVVRNVDEHQIVLLEYWTLPGDELPGPDTTLAYPCAKDVAIRARVVQLDRVPDPFPCTCDGDREGVLIQIVESADA
jgi:hypothetical protein